MNLPVQIQNTISYKNGEIYNLEVSSVFEKTFKPNHAIRFLIVLLDTRQKTNGSIIYYKKDD